MVRKRKYQRYLDTYGHNFAILEEEKKNSVLVRNPNEENRQPVKNIESL